METERFDTVVIGAGQAGLSAGYHLQRGGPVVRDPRCARRGSATPGATATTRCGCSRPPWAVDSCRAAASRRRARPPDEGRDGRLPGGVRRPVRPARRAPASASTGSRARATATSCPRRRRPDRGRPRDRGVRRAPRPARAGVRPRARSVDRPAALERVPQPVAAPRRAACWSWARATRAPTSRSNCRARARRGYRVPCAATSPRTSTRGSRATSCSGSSGSSGVHVLTLRTPIGRKARAKEASQGDMLVRVKPKQLVAAGIERVPKTVGVTGGLPMLEDGRVLDVANVIWCTGYRHDLSWIDLPIFGEDGELEHERGVVTTEPGLYFVGLPSSSRPSTAGAGAEDASPSRQRRLGSAHARGRGRRSPQSRHDGSPSPDRA